MSRMTRTAWDLNSTGEHWSTKGLCRRYPEAWTEVKVSGGTLAPANARALLTCHTACPVLDQCRADMLTWTQEARANTIAGGDVYNTHGHPYGPERIDRWLGRLEGREPPAKPRRRRAYIPKPPRALEPHGTTAAYQRHRRNGEKPCEPCRAAKTAANVKSLQQIRNGAVRTTPNQSMPHGTTSAYRAHLTHGQLPCEACLEAWRTFERDRKRAARARERADA